MIDWINLLENALWILGLALALATFSYASWQASFYHEKLRLRLGKPRLRAVFDLSGLLFSAGLASTSHAIYEVILWAILGVLFLIQMVAAFRRARGGQAGEPSPGHGPAASNVH